MRSLALLGLAVVACGKPTPAQPIYQATVAPPARGFQLVGPEIDIPAGQEQQWCTPFEPLAHETTVVALEGYQAPGGHHVALFTLTKSFKPGAYRCDGSEGALDMVNWRFVDGVNAGIAHKLPDGVALTISAGKTLMMQSHYVAGKDPIRVRDVLNVIAGDPGQKYIQANYWLVGDVNIRIPVGPSYQTAANCTLDANINVLDVRGHTHQYGNLFQLDLTRAGAGSSDQLYRETNGLLMRNDPPRKSYPIDAPLPLKAGDTLRYTCGWSNTTDHAIQFPEEMCQGLLLYYPSKGFVDCNAGSTVVLE